MLIEKDNRRLLAQVNHQTHVVGHDAGVKRSNVEVKSLLYESPSFRIFRVEGVVFGVLHHQVYQDRPTGGG